MPHKPPTGTTPAAPIAAGSRRPPPPLQALSAHRAALIGTIWTLLFLGVFFSRDIANGQLSRLALLVSLPELLISSIPHTPGTGWKYLPQRFDLIPTAACILIGSWGVGRLALRCIGLKLPWRSAADLGLALSLGLSLWSLVVLAIGLVGVLSQWGFVSVLAAAAVCEVGLILKTRGQPANGQPANEPEGEGETNLTHPTRRQCLLLVSPFVLAMILGAMLPSMDFDVKEYHLEGPKEHFQAGKIRQLPHNVYTSFPFLTEMLSLSAMVVQDDWDRGARAGKLLLMSYAPLTATGVFLLARTLFGPLAGWIGVLVHLTTPWVFRISIIAYTEGGLSCYLVWALFAGVEALRHTDSRRQHRWLLVAGLLAGSAAACKYPGVLSVAFPMGLVALCVCFRRPSTDEAASGASRFRTLPLAMFVAGGAIAFGPWLVKNSVETGNPVYPLLWSVLGGESFDHEIQTRWQQAHSPPVELLERPSQILPDLVKQMRAVTLGSTWQSPLVFALAPVSLLLTRRSSAARWLWVYLLWLLLSWCWLTHRIDRFWVPMLPVVCVLAGVGGAILRQAWCRALEREPTLLLMAGWSVLRIAALASVLFNLGIVVSGISGYNAFLTEEGQLRAETETSTVTLARQALRTPRERVLFVGEAAVFDADFAYAYNTVFDHSLLVQWCADENRPGATGLAPPEEIRENLTRHEIDWIAVNWSEVVRYRLPGSYGFPDFVHPQRFQTLVDRGILTRTRHVEDIPWTSVSEQRRRLIDEWAPQLRVSREGEWAFRSIEVFAVNRASDR